MKKLSFLALFGVILFLASCGPSKVKMEDQIISMEKRLFDSQNGFTRSGADSLIQQYQDFAEAWPEDSLAPVYLFKAATMLMNLNVGPRSIGIFEEIRNTWPDYEKAPLCLFFTGYVYENVQGDIDKARETYALFIETYPDHDFVDDAKASINNLGKTPEQMIEEFEAMQEAAE